MDEINHGPKQRVVQHNAPCSSIAQLGDPARQSHVAELVTALVHSSSPRRNGTPLQSMCNTPLFATVASPMLLRRERPFIQRAALQ